jgi:deazaflavin-dependent oxidoreductase (nitroreductase family)
MPFPHAIARTNRYWINPIARQLVGTAIPFMLIQHRGRLSGRGYETPVWAFPTERGFIIVLTYGPRTDWLRNMQAASECRAIFRKARYRLSNPQVIRGVPKSQPIPRVVRVFATVIGVRDFLLVDAVVQIEEGA